MGKTQIIGNSGESFVAEFLKKKGYIISAKNYRTKFGEIDVIAENNDEILFVEVKTRKETSLVRPYEYVNKDKQRKIFVTANIYLQHNGFGLNPRFDVAEVFVSDDGSMRLNYFENAFGADTIEDF